MPTVLIGAFIVWGVVSSGEREVKQLKDALKREVAAREKLAERLAEQRVHTAIDLENLRGRLAQLIELAHARESEWRAALAAQDRRLDRIVDQVTNRAPP